MHMAHDEGAEKMSLTENPLPETDRAVVCVPTERNGTILKIARRSSRIRKILPSIFNVKRQANMHTYMKRFFLP